MPLKVWYNGAMRPLTETQMLVTFINGEKKYLPKGVTFINGEKVILWDVGNFSIDSWTLIQLAYTGTQQTPIGLYADYNKVNYAVGDTLNRSNVANISSPYLENTVANGIVTSWNPMSQTGNTEVFEGVGDYRTVTSYRVPRNPTARTATTTYITYYNVTTHYCGNTFTVNTDTMDMTTNTTEYKTTASGPYLTVGSFSNTNKGRIYAGSSIGWISVIAQSGGYLIGKGSSDLVTIAANGYSGTLVPDNPLISNFNNQYLLMSYEYQATSGGVYTYGIKRVTLSNGAVTDIVSNLPNPVTSIMVDGSYIIYTTGNTVRKINISGTDNGSYTNNAKNMTLLGRIGLYYYVASNRQSGQSYFMDIYVVRKSNMGLFHKQETNIRMMFINPMPYISNNQYLCFGSWHGISGSLTYSSTPLTSASSTKVPTIRGTYTTTATTWTELEQRISRIKGY